jgi:hypothetical protein
VVVLVVVVLVVREVTKQQIHMQSLVMVLAGVLALHGLLIA